MADLSGVNPNRAALAQPDPIELAAMAMPGVLQLMQALPERNAAGLASIGEMLRGGRHFAAASVLFAACAALDPNSPHFLLAKLVCQLRGGVPMAADDISLLDRMEPHFGRYLSGLRLVVGQEKVDPARVLTVLGNGFESFNCGSELDWLYVRVAAMHYAPQQAYPLSGADLIPARLFFYWDVDPPREVVENVNAHRQTSSMDVQFYTRETAVAFLEDIYGVDCRKVFEALRHPAEESDYLRYHLVHYFGGYYVDTDEFLKEPQLLREMARGNEALFFLAPTGPVINGLFGACAGSPTLEEALRVVVHNCYARPSDNIWLKTGPGALTRAVVRVYRRSFEMGATLPRFRVCAEGDFSKVVQGVPMSYRGDARNWRVFESGSE